MYLFQSDILDIEKSLARIKTSKKRDSNREERIEESLKKIMLNRKLRLTLIISPILLMILTFLILSRMKNFFSLLNYVGHLCLQQKLCIIT